MIKINLALRKNSQTEAEKANKGLGALLNKINVSSEEKPALIQSVGIAIGVILILVGFGFYKDKQKNELESRSAQLDQELNSLNAELTKMKGFEMQRAELEKAQASIQTKIDTIQALLNDRATPPKVLITLSKTIPKDVWLTDFKIDPQGQVAMKGASLGISPISDFMKGLEESVFFNQVELKRTQSSREQGTEVATFELEAKRR